MVEIKNRWTGAVIKTVDATTLSRANLSRANLSEANLYEADLSGANFYGANLYRANLDGANFYGANLYRANLDGAEIEFNRFPSIRLLSSMNLGILTPELSLELMRRDAYAHPHPERFDVWAASGKCPYQNEERFWLFELRQEDWKPGPPELADRDLILAICKEKGWGIASYLEMEVKP